MIDGYALPRRGSSKNGVSGIALPFAAPWDFRHGSVEAAGAAVRTNASEALGDLAMLGENLEAREGLVSEAIMPPHEFCLVVGGSHTILILLGEGTRRIVSKVVSNDGR